MSPVEQLLRDFVRLCESSDIPYAIVGGWAVRAYGIPRPTYDVDVTISIEREDLSNFFDSIDALGYDVDDVYRNGWTGSVAGMPLVKAKTFVDGRTLTGDIFLAENKFQLSMMSRRRLANVDNLTAQVISAEDLILMKLVADRPRDRADVFDIFFMLGQLDEDYLRHWAERLGVSDKLERALSEASEST